MTAPLAHRLVTAPGADPPPERTVVVLHGILGSLGNWRSFVRGMVSAHPGWRFLLADLRGHGDSHGPPAPHTVTACADDVLALCEHLSLTPTQIWGHSFGGKVALMAGLRAPDHVRDVWVLDSHPGVPGPATGRSASDVEEVLAAVSALTPPFTDRDTVSEALRARGFGPSLAAWMTTNVRRDRDSGGYTWRFDLGVVSALLADYYVLDLWEPMAEAGRVGRPGIHLVRGARSDRWSDQDVARLDTLASEGCLELHTLDAGHWVHVDAPKPLARVLGAGLDTGP